MTQLNMLLRIEGTDYFIETNLNLKSNSNELYAQVWYHPSVQSMANCLHTSWGEHAITDAVLWISEYMGEMVAHRLTRQA